MQTVTIQTGTGNDFEMAKKIARECNFLSWSKGSVKSWAETAGSIFLVAKVEGKAVGFILSRTILDEAEILVLALSKNYRNRGIGTLLLKKNIELLKKQKVRRIFLEVGVDNAHAIHLYENAGFQVEALRKKYYDGRRDAYTMSLK